MDIGSFVIDNVEYIVAIGGGIGAFVFFKTKKFTGRRCNLTRYVIKYNKQRDVLNKQSKSSGTLF